MENITLMRCPKCGRFDFDIMYNKRELCLECKNHMKSLVHGLVEYFNILYSMFLKADIVESDYIIETCKSLCRELSVFEKLGIHILGNEFHDQLKMKTHFTKIFELKEKIIEIDKKIKETNIRRQLYISAETYKNKYEFENARIEFVKLHDMYPYDIHPILEIADMYRKLNKLDEAINFLLACKSSQYYTQGGNTGISYRHNLDKKLRDLEEKQARGYIYRPRNKAK